MAALILQLGVLLFGLFLAGHWQRLPAPASINLGFALVAKGEFSIILAGVAAKIARPEIHLEALIAFMVLLMSVIGPTLMKESSAIIEFGVGLFRRRADKPVENDKF